MCLTLYVLFAPTHFRAFVIMSNSLASVIQNHSDALHELLSFCENKRFYIETLLYTCNSLPYTIFLRDKYLHFLKSKHFHKHIFVFGSCSHVIKYSKLVMFSSVCFGSLFCLNKQTFSYINLEFFKLCILTC